MVDDFLNVTRIEQGRMTYSMAPKNLCEIVAEVTGELAVVAQKRDITLASNCDIETSPWVYADAGKLKQIFSNLIDNAIKYTPKGSITVSVTVRKQANMALVAIKDTGIGIAPDEISSLFHKFNRASNANEQNVLGTGLGLYIAREIVKAHNGWVHVESPGLGKGSTFTAELPMVDPPEPSEEKKDTDKE
jgi:signal transduction histidine kinase